MNTNKKVKFKFVNYAGTYQVRIKEPDDIKAVLLLDDPLWIATSAPTYQLRCDSEFLSFLDKDNDGRILSNDLRETVTWLTSRLSTFEGLARHNESLDLEHIHKDTEEGRRILTTARRILSNLGQPDAGSITLAQVRNENHFRSGRFYSGDGVITARETDDENIKNFLSDIIEVMGPAQDVNGDNGINAEKLEAFVKCSEKLLEWMENAEKSENVSLFPLGKETSKAYTLVEKLNPAFEQFFRLSSLYAINRIMEAPTPSPACSNNLFNDKNSLEHFLFASPIARPDPDGFFSFDSDINPVYAEDIKTLETEVINPLLGDKPDRKITEQDWKQVNAAFTAYRKWLADKPGGNVEKLGPAKLRSYLSGDMPAKLKALIAEDNKIGEELSATKDLENLILLHRWLLDFCNNFVNFHYLYSPDQTAMFETGRLVIAGREFKFCIKIKDPASHLLIAKESGIFLLYLEVTGAAPEEKFNIVTPVTSESSRGLTKGRRGVFFDLDGKEWDACVTHVAENPVSLKQAILQPFVRIGTALANSFEKLVGSAEQQIDSNISSKFNEAETGLKTNINTPAQPAPATVQTPQKTGSNREWFLTGSLAFAALGSSLAFITKTFANLHWMHLVSTIGVILGIILIPVILIADFKLSRRNLSAILQASGWAINAEMRLSRKLAKILAPSPQPPAGFSKIRRDIIAMMWKQQKKLTYKETADKM